MRTRARLLLAGLLPALALGCAETVRTAAGDGGGQEHEPDEFCVSGAFSEEERNQVLAMEASAHKRGYVVRAELKDGRTCYTRMPSSTTGEEAYVLTYAIDGIGMTVTENRPYRDGEPATIVKDFPSGKHIFTGRNLEDAECKERKKRFDDSIRDIEAWVAANPDHALADSLLTGASEVASGMEAVICAR